MYYILIKKFYVQYPCGLRQHGTFYRLAHKDTPTTSIHVDFHKALEDYKQIVRHGSSWMADVNNNFGDFQHCCQKANNIYCTVTTTIEQRETWWDKVKDFFKSL